MKTEVTPSVQEITTDQLRRSLAEERPVRVLDVRPQKKFEEWHVPGSQHIGGYEALKQGREDVYEDLSFPDDEILVTVCGAGKTSKIAARQLQEKGKEVYSLKGGMRQWTLAWNTADIRFPDANAAVVQIRRTGKGCLSYLIGSRGEALVIDPSIAPEIYEKEAAERNLEIVGVLDTHVHADHLSRARPLAKSTGAHLYHPTRDGSSRLPLEDLDRIEVGKTALTILHTPGHSPDSRTVRLGDRALFTGDTLFLRGVGRPDLNAGQKEMRKKARRLYESLRRIAQLPDSLRVLPGHVSRPVPFDETVVGATLSTVKQEVDALGWPEERFVEEVLGRVPPTPPNHESIITHNETGRWPEQEEIVDLEAGANRCAIG